MAAIRCNLMINALMSPLFHQTLPADVLKNPKLSLRGVRPGGRRGNLLPAKRTRSLGARRLFVAAVITACAFSITQAQLTSRDKQEISGLEQRAFGFLEQENFARAAALFAELKSRFPASGDNESWLFNLARSQYYLDDLDGAARRFQELTERYPASRLMQFAHRYLGGIAFRQGDAPSAAAQFLSAYNSASDDRLLQIVARELKEFVRDNPQHARIIVNETTLSVSRRQELFSSLETELRPYLEAEEIKSLRDHRRLAGGPESKKHGIISLALPLSGKLERYGQRIERGALLAARHAESERGVILDFETTDTKGSAVNASRAALAAQNSDALAIIGPLTSEEAVAVSATLNCAEISALAPAASQADFTQLSEATFQMTPSPEMVGRRLAEYAFMEIPASTAAALAPNSDNERRMAEAFVARFESLGGEIVAYEIFPPRATDFGGFCRKIKDHFLSAYEENAVMLNTNGDTLNLNEAPVEIGCIFVSATQSQLKLALPQINFHNIFTTLLGSDGLMSQNIREMTLQNVRRVIFSSNLAQNTGSEAYITFAERYRQAYGEPPDRLAALGYDAVNLIVNGILSGAETQSRMRKYLSKVQNYSGVSGEITFGADHTNHAIALYTYASGQRQRIDWDGPATTLGRK